MRIVATAPSRRQAEMLLKHYAQPIDLTDPVNMGGQSLIYRVERHVAHGWRVVGYTRQELQAVVEEEPAL